MTCALVLISCFVLTFFAKKKPNNVLLFGVIQDVSNKFFSFVWNAFDRFFAADLTYLFLFKNS